MASTMTNSKVALASGCASASTSDLPPPGLTKPINSSQLIAPPNFFAQLPSPPQSELMETSEPFQFVASSDAYEETPDTHQLVGLGLHLDQETSARFRPCSGFTPTPSTCELDTSCDEDWTIISKSLDTILSNSSFETLSSIDTDYRGEDSFTASLDDDTDAWCRGYDDASSPSQFCLPNPFCPSYDDSGNSSPIVGSMPLFSYLTSSGDGNISAPTSLIDEN